MQMSLHHFFAFAAISTPSALASDSNVDEKQTDQSADSNAKEDGENQQDEKAFDGVLVVTATRTEMSSALTPVATEVISRQDIEMSGAMNLADILDEHPGVIITPTVLGASIQIQGMEPEHVLVLIDGERMLGEKGGIIDISRVPQEMIERIEVVKGPSSALYGSDAMGGVINVITRRNKEAFSTTYKLRAGNLSAVNANVGLGMKLGRLSNQFIGGYVHRDAFDLNENDLATSGSSVSQYNVKNQLRYTQGSGLELIGDLSYLRRNLNGIDLSDGGAIFDRTNLIEDFQSSFKSRMNLSETSQLKSSVGYSIYRDQYLQDQRESDQLDSYQETYEYMGQGLLQYDTLISTQHFLTFGLDALYQQMTSSRLVDNEGKRYRLAMFAQDVWTIDKNGSQLIAAPGLRVDFDSTFGVNPTPKLAFRYIPSSTLNLLASYGWGFRAPSFKELLLRFENPSVGYVVSGNLALKPEKSQSIQAGAEWKPLNILHLKSNVFFNSIVNLINIGTLNEPELGETVLFGYENIDSAMTYGFESTIDYKLNQSTKIQLGYTLTNTLDEELNRPLEGRAQHRATALFKGELSDTGMKAYMRAAVVGPKNFYIDSDSDGLEDVYQTEPYATVDLRIAQPFFSLFEVAMGVDNIFNAGEVGFNPLPPRFFYVGLNGLFRQSTKTPNHLLFFQ